MKEMHTPRQQEESGLFYFDVRKGKTLRKFYPVQGERDLSWKGVASRFQRRCSPPNGSTLFLSKKGEVNVGTHLDYEQGLSRRKKGRRAGLQKTLSNIGRS